MRFSSGVGLLQLSALTLYDGGFEVTANVKSGEQPWAKGSAISTRETADVGFYLIEATRFFHRTYV